MKLVQRNPLARLFAAVWDRKFYAASFLSFVALVVVALQPSEGVLLAVATRDIANGETISEAMVTSRRFPEGAFAAGAIRWSAYREQPDRIVGQAATRDIYSGEPIYSRSLSQGIGTVAYSLQPDEVAFELRAENLLSPPPVLETNDRVSVYAYDRDNGNVVLAAPVVRVVRIRLTSELFALGGQRNEPRQIQSVTIAVTDDPVIELTRQLGKGSRLQIVVLSKED